MDGVSTLMADLSEAANDVLVTVVTYIPSLVGALVLLLLGWIIARLIRAGIVKGGDAANRVLDRFLRAGSWSRVRLSTRVLVLVGNAAFWVVILFFITAATETAHLDAFSSWLDRVIAYLPTLVAGGLIVLVGYLVSTLVRDLVSATVSSAGLGQSDLFGTLAQGVTFLTAIVIGMDQIGVDVTFLVTIVAIAIAAVLGSLSLAFGLGARTLVSNLIGGHYLQQELQPGQMARFGSVQGEVLELTPTSVILATPEGRMSIPAKLFDEEITIVMTPGDDDA